MLTRHARSLTTTIAALTIAVLSAPVAAQDQQELSDRLDEFIHYVFVNNHELANANANVLLDADLEPRAFLELVEDLDLKRFGKAIQQARQYTELEGASGALADLYQQGRLDTARHAEEISRNISLLTGDRRNKVFARDALKFAGEYAMPQLLTALLDGGNPELQAEVRQLMVDMQRHSIMPLVSALPDLSPASQELVVMILGDIQYTTSLPFLYELYGQTGNSSVREAIRRSVTKIRKVWNPDASLSDRFVDLASRYYNESASLTSFPNEPVQLLWSYRPESGLIPLAVPTVVYHEAVSMHLCERALKADNQDQDAMSLWIASNFSREIDLGEGETDPSYADSRRDPMYYAVAAGPAVTQPVLATALRARDTQLARKAIYAIERTAGGDSLWGGPGERAAIVDALRYPDRRVQYEAALAIAAAQPRSEFDGVDRVVPILASAIRDASDLFAIIVSRQESQGPLARLAEAQGYTVLASGRTLSDCDAAIAEAPGIDLILTDLPTGATRETVNAAHGRTKLLATPILAVVGSQGFRELEPAYRSDRSVSVVRSGIDDRAIANRLSDLEAGAVGGRISEEDARTYKEASLAMLRDLAVSGGTTLNVGDAAGPMISALDDSPRAIKLGIAEVLSYVALEDAQIAIMDEALKANGAESIELMNHVAGSAKRWGNMLRSQQVNRLVKSVTELQGDEATAAAALMGALDLPNDQLLPLILNAGE